MLEFKINEQLPSLNDYINKLKSPNGKVMGARFKREVDALCMGYIQPYKLRIAAYCKEPVIIRFVWYEKSHRRDVDNVYSAKKYILDAMQKCGALENDNPAHVRNVTDEIHYGESDFVLVKIVRISELVEVTGT